MASFVPTSAETLDDRRRYTEAELVEIACSECQARVGVRKNSEHHTSVQWTGAARDACHEFDRDRSGPGGRDSHKPCTRLM
ncbi:MAG: hypothetical protein L0H31_15050, partial [Nocardioidaceae bacterium]|nr:hypothetical protein [Nocardioidaceae bacterium]